MNYAEALTRGVFSGSRKLLLHGALIILSGKQTHIIGCSDESPSLTSVSPLCITGPFTPCQTVTLLYLHDVHQ